MRKPGKQNQNVPPYIVPLSVQALEIVRHLLDQVVPAQRYLFAYRSDMSKRISENTLNPELSIDLHLSDASVELIAEGFDTATRPWLRGICARSPNTCCLTGVSSCPRPPQPPP